MVARFIGSFQQPESQKSKLLQSLTQSIVPAADDLANAFLQERFAKRKQKQELEFLAKKAEIAQAMSEGKTVPASLGGFDQRRDKNLVQKLMSAQEQEIQPPSNELGEGVGVEQMMSQGQREQPEMMQAQEQMQPQAQQKSFQDSRESQIENLDREIERKRSLQKNMALLKEPTVAKSMESEIKSLEKNRERLMKPREEWEKVDVKRGGEYLDEVEKLQTELPISRQSLEVIKASSDDLDKWDATKDYLADFTGFEGFKSEKGAELDSAIKNYFLGDLSRIKGGRPNILIEKNLLQAYPRSGYSLPARQVIITGMEMKEKLQKLEIETANRVLGERDMPPAMFKRKVFKEMAPQAAKIEEEAIKRMADINRASKKLPTYLKNRDSSERVMMDSSGVVGAIKYKDVPRAKQEGYILLEPLK